MRWFFSRSASTAARSPAGGGRGGRRWRETRLLSGPGNYLGGGSNLAGRWRVLCCAVCSACMSACTAALKSQGQPDCVECARAGACERSRWSNCSCLAKAACSPKEASRLLPFTAGEVSAAAAARNPTHRPTLTRGKEHTLPPIQTSNQNHSRSTHPSSPRIAPATGTPAAAPP